MKIKVLVVDDDEDLLFLAEKFLGKSNEDFELVSATTDQEALRLLEEARFDAIVCDHYLGPESMTGLDLLEWVRNVNRGVPFIIFTGRSQESVAIRALNMGADYYLKKDTDQFRELFNQLSAKIRSAVDVRRAEEKATATHSELEKRVAQRTREFSETNKRLEAEIDERKRMEEALLLQRDLGNNLCKATDLDDAFAQTMKTVLQLDSIDSGAVYVVNKATGSLEPSVVQGTHDSLLSDLLESREDQEIDSEICFTAAELRNLEPFQTDGRDYTAVVLIPITFEDKITAVLVFASHSLDSIPESDRHTLEAIAVQMEAYLVRENATEAMIESKKEMMAVFDSLEEALFIVDRNWRVLRANNAAQNLVGGKKGDLSGLDVLSLYIYDTSAFAEQATKIAEKGGLLRIDVPLKSARGVTTQTDTRVVRGRYAGQDVLFVISRPTRNT